MSTNHFESTSNFGEGSVIQNTSWGKYSGCNINCFLNRVKIGNYVSIAGGVKAGLGRHRYENFTTYHSPLLYDAKLDDEWNYTDKEFLIKINHDVWIGENVIIQNGITIGTGAVVASGSIVTKSVPPYAIVGGNPAKIIKYRFPEDIRISLMKTNWWDYDMDELAPKVEQLQELVGYSRSSFMAMYWKEK